MGELRGFRFRKGVEETWVQTNLVVLRKVTAELGGGGIDSEHATQVRRENEEGGKGADDTAKGLCPSLWA